MDFSVHVPTMELNVMYCLSLTVVIILTLSPLLKCGELLLF